MAIVCVQKQIQRICRTFTGVATDPFILTSMNTNYNKYPLRMGERKIKKKREREEMKMKETMYCIRYVQIYYLYKIDISLYICIYIMCVCVL